MNQFWNKHKVHLLILSAVYLLSSCIDGYHDDWTFNAGVKNTTLSSPDSAQITFSTNLNNELVINWPVVLGASGYEFSMYIVDDPANPVAVGTENEIIDGCSTTRPLQEETKYKIVIKALGNEKLNNKDAELATATRYSTLLPAHEIIPDGTDLYQYFNSTIIPDSTGPVVYEMVPEGQYQLSGPVDFQKHWVILRGDKVKRSNITYGSAGRLRITSGFTLKYLNIDCDALGPDVTDAAMILMSSTPDPGILNTSYNSYYIINKNIEITSCNLNNINRRVLTDANVKYCIANFKIEDCIISLKTLNDASGGIIYMQGGFINNFTIKNSTVWGSAKTGGYFLRYNNSGRPDRAGFTSGSINFLNNTFYNVVYSGQMGNYSGMNSALVKLQLNRNIFVDCGSNYVVRRLSVSSTNMVRVNFGYNNYWYDGAFPLANEIERADGDKSKTEIKIDPSFANPSNGDFTINSSSTDIITNSTGDPRWIPAQ